MLLCNRCQDDTPAEYAIGRSDTDDVTRYKIHVCKWCLPRMINTICEREPDELFTIRKVK